MRPHNTRSPFYQAINDITFLAGKLRGMKILLEQSHERGEMTDNTETARKEAGKRNSFAWAVVVGFFIAAISVRWIGEWIDDGIDFASLVAGNPVSAFVSCLVFVFIGLIFRNLKEWK